MIVQKGFSLNQLVNKHLNKLKQIQVICRLATHIIINVQTNINKVWIIIYSQVNQIVINIQTNSNDNDFITTIQIETKFKLNLF